MGRMPKHRRPTTPGEILLHDFLEPLGMSQSELARRIHVPFPRVNDLVHGRRAVSIDTAMRLGKLFDTGPDIWMSLQAKVDLWDALHGEAAEVLERIDPVRAVR